MKVHLGARLIGNQFLENWDEKLVCGVIFKAVKRQPDGCIECIDIIESIPLSEGTLDVVRNAAKKHQDELKISVHFIAFAGWNALHEFIPYKK